MYNTKQCIKTPKNNKNTICNLEYTIKQTWSLHTVLDLNTHNTIIWSKSLALNLRYTNFYDGVYGLFPVTIMVAFMLFSQNKYFLPRYFLGANRYISAVFNLNQINWWQKIEIVYLSSKTNVFSYLCIASH